VNNYVEWEADRREGEGQDPNEAVKEGCLRGPKIHNEETLQVTLFCVYLIDPSEQRANVRFVQGADIGTLEIGFNDREARTDFPAVSNFHRI